ncbi:MAG TPA: hypothetical protein VK307_08795 [Thermoleophilaceae bacterium]|nr:hypothetical protein [Thermoleophilaceae bacterium]
MKRTLLLIPALVAALGTLAPAASARIVELGATTAPVQPTCPAERCPALVRMTGYQGRAAGGRKNPYYIRRDGYLTAFTVNLGTPTAEQLEFFNGTFGNPAAVRLSVLRRGTTHKTRLQHRLVQQSDVFRVDRYFGSSPTFVLNPPLRVKEGNWIALTVPTWAPAFTVNLTGDDWWRASRPRTSCEVPKSLEDFAMEDLRHISIFGCTYSRARLLYTVTYIPDNRATVKDEEG